MILFSSIIAAGCLKLQPKKINGIEFSVQVENNRIVPDSVEVRLTPVDLTEYRVPGVDYPPFLAFRGYIVPKENRSITHSTYWGLVQYRGSGRYRVVLITENGYSPKKGDEVRYYITLRSRDVRWSSSFVSGSRVLE
ncbi:MAG: hypothetical protein GXO66_09695 [Euryarchaeota archaeon]|nr:hypothetical protein [Euryarchaeota archaeon]